MFFQINNDDKDRKKNFDNEFNFHFFLPQNRKKNLCKQTQYAVVL